jgi:hypothetical protein
MPIINPSPLLRWALFADAAISGATGLLMTLGAAHLTGLLGVPAGLMRYAGLSLLPFAALLAYLATRARLPRPIIWAVIACNAFWAADSILLLLTGWVGPTALGYAFVITQALAVAAFAEAQHLGLRRSPATAA